MSFFIFCILLRFYRRELYKTGVTVHIVEPGMFLTPIFDLDKARNLTKKAIAEADKEVLAYYGEKESEQSKFTWGNIITHRQEHKFRRYSDIIMIL